MALINEVSAARHQEFVRDWQSDNSEYEECVDREVAISGYPLQDGVFQLERIPNFLCIYVMLADQLVSVSGSRAFQSRDNGYVIRAGILPLAFLLTIRAAHAATLTPETTNAFDRYVTLTEARMNLDLAAPQSFFQIADAPDSRAALRAGETRIQAHVTRDDGKPIHIPGGMIQDWIGAMFIPGATIARVKAVLQDYDHYRDFYKPEVTESRQTGGQGDEYDVFLRLYKKQVLTVVLNTAYHVRYVMPDSQRMTVVSHSTRIAQAKDPKHPDAGEEPVGNDTGFLWRLNSYWRFEASDGGVYAECEAISLSRDIPGFLAWMVRSFVEKFPKESMQNTLRGTKAAVLKH